MRPMPAISILTLALTVAASAAQMARPVTVDDYTAAQKDKAFAEARAQGYSGMEVTMAQTGDLFLNADKGGQEYMLTVTPDGKVYASMPSTPSTPAPV
ncbi:MAG TPA: hypothetical protein VHV26_15070 [Rhizomicrobium sp.]|jgi:hypothetical protein|nr:hypothetical protein [Rhizomicrobium sp.]